MGEGIKDRLSKRLEPFGRLRLEVSHGTIIAYSALALILFVSFVIRVMPLRWENLASGTTTLNEFDPFYQFTVTQFMVNHGLLSPYWPTHWINNQLWYPYGLNMATALPSIPITGAAVYDVIHALGANVNMMTLCALIPPAIGVLSVYIMYLLGKDIGGRAVGLFSALFIALEPSIIERTSLGFFDTQVPGTIGLILFVFLFLRSIDNNKSLRASILYSMGAAATLAYFIAGWGGAYYMIDATVLFMFVMLLLRRYSQRLLVSYSITFGLALMIATKVPYMGLGYLTSGAILPVAAGFVVLLIAELLHYNLSLRTKLTVAAGLLVVVVGGFVGLSVTGLINGSGITGKFETVLNPFVRASSPIINSVAEQQLTTWGNVYLELGVGILFFLVGMYFILRNPTTKNVFFIIFAVTALFFAASMIRLLAIFAPAFAIIAAVGILSVLKPFYTLLKESPRSLAKTKRKLARVSKEYSGVAIFLIFLILVLQVAFTPQIGGVPRSINQSFIPTALSASSLPIGGTSLTQAVNAWTSALSWLKNNAPANSVAVSWWDYGDWLSDIGNVTTLCDNTTYNATQIGNVGLIMMGNENQSLMMLNHYENFDNPGRVNYVVVFLVLAIRQTGSGYLATAAGYGDEGKFPWMARISGTYEQTYIDDGYMGTTNGFYQWKDESTFGSTDNKTSLWDWNQAGDNCTINEIMYNAEQHYVQAWSQSVSLQTAWQINGAGQTAPWQATTPSYFTPVEIAGINTSPFQYGGLVPLVAIYQVNYAAYYAETGATGTGVTNVG